MESDNRSIKHLSDPKNVKIHHGKIAGKDVVYFKGKRAVESLMKCEWITDPVETIKNLLAKGLLLRIKRTNSKQFAESDSKEYNQTFLYTTKYDLNSVENSLGKFGLYFALFIGALFPIWPYILQRMMLYATYFFILIIGSIAWFSIVRLLVYIPLRIIGRPGWVFPNLYCDVGLFDTFRPFFAWD